MSGLVIPPGEGPRLGAALVTLGEVLIAIGQAQTEARAPRTEPELLRWDRRHLNVLRRFAGSMPAAELAELFGVSERALRNAASRASISLRIGTQTDTQSHQAAPSPDADAAEPPAAAPSGTGPDTGPEPVPEAIIPPEAKTVLVVDVAPEPGPAPVIEQAPSPEPVADTGAAPAPVSAGTDEETAVSSAPATAAEVTAAAEQVAAEVPAISVESAPELPAPDDAGRADRIAQYVEEARAHVPARGVTLRPARSEPIKAALQPTNNDWVRLRHRDGRWLRMDGLGWLEGKAAKRENAYLCQRRQLPAVQARFPLAADCVVVAEPKWSPRDIIAARSAT